ncbi:MAG TPA: phosphodiester glycosidase family protein [Ignavibacteriaceae bacterium]|nr:phosphodiester glycosidase family protein [Ignavibacteriaceae bacterium]
MNLFTNLFLFAGKTDYFNKVVLLLMIAFSCTVYSQVQYDTLENKIVGPGVSYIKLDVPSVPWKIDILKVDLSNPYIKVETVKSLDKLAAGREKTSAMSIRKDAVGHWSVGAINADFFVLATGAPTNIQVVNGEILRSVNPGRPVVGFDSSSNYSITSPALTMNLFVDGTTVPINLINEGRGSGQVALYNSYFGATTGTNDSGSEFILYPVNQWIVNDTIYALVDSVRINSGNTGLPAGALILSAEGDPVSFLNTNLQKNDTVKILVEVLPGINRAVEMLGGHPIVVVNGAPADLNAADPFVTTRHPRTAIGFSADSTIMYLVTVDGRQVLYSRGMDLYELADLMIDIGAHNAMNFDGGGSTTMVVRNEVVNSPSDPEGERTVSNALLVVSTAPSGPLSKLNIKPQNERVFIGKTVQFTVDGTDIYFNPITLNPASIQFSLSKQSLGNINANGLFTAGMQQDSGFVIASYQGIKDSVFIVIKGINRLEIHPKIASTDLNRILLFKGHIYDTDGMEQEIPPQSFSWVSTDTTVGVIDVFGQFQGRKAGNAMVIVSYSGFKDTAIVKVEVTTGFMIIDSLESINDWVLTTVNADSIATTISLSNEVASLGNNSLKLDYAFTYNTGEYNWAYLNKSIDVYGIPDSIIVDVYSSGANHRVFFDIEDQAGALYRVTGHKLANKPNEWEAIKGYLPKSSSVIYPIKLKTIAIPMGSSQVAGQYYTGTIYFDNLRIKFPGTTGLEDAENITATGFQLTQNYPNPFNPVTSIKYVIPVNVENQILSVKLIVYDMLGREIAILVNDEKEPGVYEVKWDASNLTSGVYFYRLAAGDFIETKKMLLLR